jgi:hypothetical protein
VLTDLKSLSAISIHFGEFFLPPVQHTTYLRFNSDDAGGFS